jgi:hypothetical protein
MPIAPLAMLGIARRDPVPALTTARMDDHHFGGRVNSSCFLDKFGAAMAAAARVIAKIMPAAEIDNKLGILGLLLALEYSAASAPAVSAYPCSHH